MASFVAICLALALSLVARSAQADFDECGLPISVPDLVLDTIVGESTFGFGDLSPQVCDAIVKKGVATCKSQVKAEDKCFRRAYDANYSIASKQCQQLEDSAARSECKAEHKASRDVGKSESLASKNDGIETCEGAFALALGTFCAVGPPM